MPKMAFTTRGIDALKPRTQPVDYWSSDPQERGFGLRVGRGGTKAWFLYTRRSRTRKAVRVTLGRFPDLKLADAREKAADARGEVKVGQNPADLRRAERAANRETVAALFDAYSQHAGVRRQAGEFRSWTDVKRSFERDVLPDWGERPLREIRRRDVVELVTKKALAGPVAANRLQAHISMLLAYGVEADWLPANPAAGIRKRPESARERFLAASEIKALWLLLDSDAPIRLSRGVSSLIAMPKATAGTVRDVFKLLLLTGQRLAETSKMKWVDVDLDAKIWTVPAEDAKNGKAHRVPLSRQALHIIQARHDAAQASAKYVLPSSAAGTASVLVWSKRTARALADAVGFSFTARDLRRTLASGLGEVGIGQDVIGLVLNHKKLGVTGRHYDLSTRETAKREALQRWADQVDTLVTGTPATVVPMRSRRT